MTQTQPHTYAEGIYFDMPEDEYHAMPMLSASGMKNMLISPTDFYYRSWLNAEKEDYESDAMLVGRAYHKRILEGKAAFDEGYCAAFEAPPDCLKTVDDIKAALLRAGHSGKSAWKKPEWVAEAMMKLPDARLFDVEKERYDVANDGKVQLAPDLLTRIELAAAMIEKHPELSKCFSGGYPEVTVIWFDDGVWFKARFDYLKTKAIADLKTFVNLMNKPVDAAIYAAMASYKYHIQAAHYLNAGDKAIQFAKDRKIFTHGAAWSSPTEEPKYSALMAFVEKLSATEQHDFFFVFQQKGIAPLARGMKFERGSMYGCGQASIERAVSLFKKYYAIYGEDVWVDDKAIASFDDSMFPPWSTEI